jgi:fucose permease
VLITAAILAIFVYGLIAPMLGALMPSYHLTDEQNGVLGLAQAAGLVIATLSAGPVIDLRGNKSALLFGLFLVAAALFGAPNAGGYKGLLVVYFVLGLGGGIVVTGANSLAGLLSPESRGSALNFLNLFFGLGGILTTWAASYLFAPLPLCYAIAGLTLVALLVNALAKMPRPAGEVAFRPSEIPVLLTSAPLLLLSIFMFLYVACEVGVWNWLKIYLISTGMSAQRAGGVVSYGFALGILVGRVVVSRALTSVKGMSVLTASGVMISITTFAVLQPIGPTGLTVAVFCAGLAMAPVFPTALATTADITPRGTATALGIVITFGWMGLAVSSSIIGKVSATSSLQQALLLLPAFGVAMVLASVVLRLFSQRPRSVTA